MNVPERLQSIERELAEIATQRRALDQQESKLRDEMILLQRHKEDFLSNRSRVTAATILSTISKSAIRKCLARYDGGLTAAELRDELSIAGYSVKAVTLRSHLYRMKEAEQISLVRHSHKWTVRKCTN